MILHDSVMLTKLLKLEAFCWCWRHSSEAQASVNFGVFIGYFDAAGDSGDQSICTRYLLGKPGPDWRRWKAPPISLLLQVFWWKALGSRCTDRHLVQCKQLRRKATFQDTLPWETAKKGCSDSPRLAGWRWHSSLGTVSPRSDCTVAVVSCVENTAKLLAAQVCLGPWFWPSSCLADKKLAFAWWQPRRVCPADSGTWKSALACSRCNAEGHDQCIFSASAWWASSARHPLQLAWSAWAWEAWLLCSWTLSQPRDFAAIRLSHAADFQHLHRSSHDAHRRLIRLRPRGQGNRICMDLSFLFWIARSWQTAHIAW